MELGSAACPGDGGAGDATLDTADLAPGAAFLEIALGSTVLTPRLDATWFTAAGLWGEQGPSNRGETTSGGITLGMRNGEGYPMALCPGVKYNGANAEHSCMGGNGTTGGRGQGGWGNQREWSYDVSWFMASRMRSAAVMVFTR